MHENTRGNFIKFNFENTLILADKKKLSNINSVILLVFNNYFKYFTILQFNEPTRLFQVPSAFSCSFWRLRNFSSFAFTFSLCSSLSLSRACNKINYPKNNQYHINEF